MRRVFAFPMAPANYTLDLISNVYRPLSVGYAFICGGSEASNSGCGDSVVLSALSGWGKRFAFIWQTLKENDVFVVNSYVEKISVLIIFVNILFFRKRMGISSDTQLRVPTRRLQRLCKAAFLRFIFTRPYMYGLPGGTQSHRKLFINYGMDEEHVITLPMMVNNARYSHQMSCASCEGKFRFLYVGRLIPCKQVDRIIEAFREVCGRCRGVELVIVGDGVERKRLEALAIGLPICFKGRLYGDDLAREFHSAHCLVLYSRYEPWGLVVNEALASGVPCIVSDEVGARFDLIEGDLPTGFVASASSLEDLASCMVKMIEDCATRNRFSENAIIRMNKWDYKFYRRQFSIFIGDNDVDRV